MYCNKKCLDCSKKLSKDVENALLPYEMPPAAAWIPLTARRNALGAPRNHLQDRNISQESKLFAQTKYQAVCDMYNMKFMLQ